MFKYGLNSAGYLSRWIKLKKSFISRQLNTSSTRRGAAHHHHEATPKAKTSGLFDWFVIKDHSKAHQGYLYREIGNLQGGANATVAKVAITCAWWWIFYHIITMPELLFGHMEYPDTSKWTNDELGIPSDDIDD